MFTVGPSMRGKNYSVDRGPVWYVATGFPAALSIQDIRPGPAGNFVAVGTASGGGAGALGAFTPDGVTWQSTTMPSGEWKRVAYGNGIWLALCGNNSQSNVGATSANGVAWTARTLPTTAYWYALGYGNGRFIATGNSISNAYWTTDGISWTTVALGTTSTWRSLAYGNGVWVLMGEGSSQCRISTDNGNSWAAGGTFATGCYDVSFINGLFYVFVAAASSTYYTSPDGVTWTSRTLPNTANFRRVPMFNPSVIGVMDNTTAYPLISVTPLTWNLAANGLPSAGAWFTAGSPGVWVAAISLSTSAAYAIL